MVGYNQAYHGSVNTPLLYANKKMVKFVYKGSTMVYQTWNGVLTFTETGSWVVPVGVNRIKIDAVGASGKTSAGKGGNGGRVQCVLTVTPGERLYFIIGKVPTGNAQTAVYNGSDIRTNYSGDDLNTDSLNSRIVIAGGGGNGDGHSGGAGGAGGNNGSSSGTAAAGSGTAPGGGGTQTAGGAGGSGAGFSERGGNGGLGKGGNGTNRNDMFVSNNASGAGGGGKYGGGGSGNTFWYWATNTGGGGGGSSFANTSRCTEIQHTQGYRSGDGYIKIQAVYI